jgi:hypothetical protein
MIIEGLKQNGDPTSLVSVPHVSNTTNSRLVVKKNTTTVNILPNAGNIMNH